MSVWVLQTMCSYLASSSAWPVLLDHRTLISVAAQMVFVNSSEGHAPSLCSILPVCVQPCR